MLSLLKQNRSIKQAIILIHLDQKNKQANVANDFIKEAQKQLINF